MSKMKTFRRVWVYARAYPFLCAATFGCAIAGTLASLVFPAVTGLVIDKVLNAKRVDLLLPYVLVVAAAFLAQNVLNALRIRYNNTFEQKVIFDLAPRPLFDLAATPAALVRPEGHRRHHHARDRRCHRHGARTDRWRRAGNHFGAHHPRRGPFIV